MSYKLSIPEVFKIVAFVCGLLGVWYTNSNKVDNLTEKVAKLEVQLEENNLEVLKNDINYIKKNQDELKTDLREFFKTVNDLLDND